MRNGFRKRKRQRGKTEKVRLSPSRFHYLEACYQRSRSLAETSDYSGARVVLRQLISEQLPPRLGALVHNDLGTLDFLAGELAKARARFERALTCDPNCDCARQNLELLERENRPAVLPESVDALARMAPPMRKVRVAVIGELFNWPSTGGGTVHTAETGKFLCRAGYDVKHFYAQYAEWGVGNVTEPLDHPAEAILFEPANWNVPEIQRRFREAVDRFAPDYVIITDSWNLKPLLAEAMRGYKYFLRLAAQECLCPLNNVRLLVDDDGNFSACPRNQLATADVCRECVANNQHRSGSLHQAERALSGYGTAEYDRKLRQAFAGAEGVLTVNPLIAAAVSPYAKAVHVVPSGFDPDRFPWSGPDAQNPPRNTKTSIFFAGLVDECMKGFHVLQAAFAKLWQQRQDFDLVVTADPPGPVDPMTRFIGWQSQSDLPRHLRQADFLVFPTVAEEALGRSAVEAMGVGRPVIASRIGGLPFTVTDGLTGLLFEPGNVDELASKIELLLDNPEMRERMGAAGRERFSKEFTWDAIIDTHYRKLFKPIDSIVEPCRAVGPVEPCCDESAKSDLFVDEVAAFFGIAKPEIERMLATYRSMHERQKQATGARQSSSLTLEQGFLICLLLSITRPATVVVAGGGPDTADNTRPFHDLRSLVGLDCQVIRYDGQEAVIVQGNADEHPNLEFNDEPMADSNGATSLASGTIEADILSRYGSGLIWIAAGTSIISENIVAATCRHFGQWIVVAGGDLRRGDNRTGIAASLGLEGLGFCGTPIDQTNATHRLKVFTAAGGLTLLIPRALAAAPAPPPPCPQ